MVSSIGVATILRSLKAGTMLPRDGLASLGGSRGCGAVSSISIGESDRPRGRWSAMSEASGILVCVKSAERDVPGECDCLSLTGGEGGMVANGRA